jgi:hypothetical protein
MLSVLPSDDDDFVYVPARLDERYIEAVLSRALHRDVAIAACECTNLCTGRHGGVSNSGATVLQLSLQLPGGDLLDVVVKILSPDAVNLFKLDLRFDARIAEVHWATWWGKQDVSWVPVVYDTRADPRSREFWIIREYLPQVGWPDTPVHGRKAFVADPHRLRLLFKHAADLHAYSRLHMDELITLFPDDLPSASASATIAHVRTAMADAAFLDAIGVDAREREVIDDCCAAAGRIPSWVEAWDAVCVTADIAPDNVGIRRSGTTEEAVTFDWGSAYLGPMEAEIAVLLSRLDAVPQDTRDELVQYYLDRYAELTGRQIPLVPFVARMPWLNFLLHLGRIAGCVDRLRWVPYETRSRDYLRLCARLCTRLLEELPFG